MSFTENMRNELLENYNESVTENGAVGYRTTGISSSLRFLRHPNRSKQFFRFVVSLEDDLS